MLSNLDYKFILLFAYFSFRRYLSLGYKARGGSGYGNKHHSKSFSGMKRKSIPESRKYRGHTYYLLPGGKNLSKSQAERMASIRKRYADRVHKKKFGSGYYVYSSE